MASPIITSIVVIIPAYFNRPFSLDLKPKIPNIILVIKRIGPKMKDT